MHFLSRYFLAGFSLLLTEPPGLSGAALAAVTANDFSSAASMNADGRYVVFSSAATDLVAHDANAFTDIFLRDLQSGLVERVSVSSSNHEADSNSDTPSISADGRFVTFSSDASNLVPGDTNGAFDVFVRDRQMGVTERVSVSSSDVQGNNNSSSYRSAISADGRFVAFHSYASNLVPADTNGQSDIFVRDRQSGQTTRVSVNSSGVQANFFSFQPAISANGRYVAFWSHASNLVPGDTNSFDDVFVHDRQTGVTERVSVNFSGVQGNKSSSVASISADGRFVAFQSLASNLVTGDTNGTSDAFVRDRQMRATERVSMSTSGDQANKQSFEPSISVDGRYVAFHSLASNLVHGDTNDTFDAFVRDRQTGQTERISVSSAGAEANADSYQPSISADGRYVAFYSFASNLVSGDTNGTSDVFVRDRQTSTVIAASTSAVSGTMGFTIKPSALAFGNQALFTAATRSLWLRNKGTAPLTIVSIELRGPNRALFTFADTCGSAVAVDGSCAIHVTFRPTSVGAKSAKLRVVAGDKIIRTRDLTGTGVLAESSP